MNGLQKEQIKNLRADGYGYKKIADILELSENTVKSFCRRNGLTNSSSEDKNTAMPVQEISSEVCRECGQPLFNTRGHRQRRFCSAECRKAYWRKNQALIERKSGVEIICSVCGRRFTDYARNNRKYCSHACYIAGRYKGGDGND